ncbi:uncharacterized protein LOC131662970 [Phymastichus coffea]|uniref:uncharacterized protein LOC131662970 n=1 Tax=Phymastichus coffea TaxID=108790 RepID=UPI00273AF6D6|nr:uncharacterized protein LOC131662970 [Phymastichus coffea]
MAIFWELLKKNDPFLQEHLNKYGNCGNGNVNYLSSTAYEEFIEEIGKTVQSEILKHIKKAKFDSVSLDGTKDRGHNDQLTIIYRYVEDDKPVERFFKFFCNQKHKAQDMLNVLITTLEENDLGIANCRSQSYDNASAMNGKYNGLQALIRKKNVLAIWVPCFGHLLNLTGEGASIASKASTSFFMFLEGLFVYFVASDIRWGLHEKIKKPEFADKGRVRVPKRIECTRWSIRGEACDAFIRSYIPILETLSIIKDDRDNVYGSKAQCEADGLLTKMCLLETGIMASFWNDVLIILNNTSNTIQSPKILINTATSCVRSLRNIVAEKISSFAYYENLGKELTNVSEYKQNRGHRRNARLNSLDYAKTLEVSPEPSELFRTAEFIPLIDTFVSALEMQISAYTEMELRFGFLSNFHQISRLQISICAKRLLDIYKDDLESNLEMELLQFQEFCSDLLEFDPEKSSREQAMYTLIIHKEVHESFPNVEIHLRMYLTIMISNCTGERSFSKLDLIKDVLRTSMTQRRLNYLTVMCTERYIVRQIDIDTLIRIFAKKKARKVYI